MADSACMSVSSVGSSSSAASFEIEREVSVMKKSKDVEQQTADSLIELVKQAQPAQKGQAAPGRVDYYA